MLSQALLALAVLPCTLAHFQLNWPSKRGFDDGQADQFPCGGFNNVQQQRTDWPISGSPLQLNMEHPQTNVAAYMAIGSNPGSGFSIKLRSQFVVEVLGDFCLGQVSVPAGLNVSDGTPATIQVVTNAHGSGGLYQCADVTLRSSPLSQSDYSSHCKNNTGARVTQENMSGSPNGTADGGSSRPSGSASGSGAATSPTSRPGAASQAQAASWLLGAVGVAGLALL